VDFDSTTRLTVYIARLQEVWGSYAVHEGLVDTGEWMGKLHVACAPWIFCYDLPCWFTIPEETAGAGNGWIYPHDPESLPILTFDDTNWAYCFTLDKWMYLTASGWIYMM
jgi:hypothetical protein